MTTKTTKWTDGKNAVVTIYDGPAEGEYPISIFSLDKNSGNVTLGKVVVDGKDRTIITPASEIEGITEKLNAYIETLKNQPNHCERCGAEVAKDAYHQEEWARFGGRAVKVAAYYCAACHGLLASIGAGEYTELQERAGNKPGYEPYTKED